MSRSYQILLRFFSLLLIDPTGFKLFTSTFNNVIKVKLSATEAARLWQICFIFKLLRTIEKFIFVNKFLIRLRAELCLRYVIDNDSV